MKNFQLENHDGSKFDLYEYQGKDFLLLVFFRGAWCNHCKKQLVDLQKNLVSFKKLKVKLLAVSSDGKFNSSLLKNFLKLKFPILSDAKFKLIDYFKLKTKYKGKPVSKPAIFLISPEKKVVYKYVGKEYDDRMSAKNILKNIKNL